jgi:hypothetical protein
MGTIDKELQSTLKIVESKGPGKFSIISRVKRSFCDCMGKKLIPLYRELHYLEIHYVEIYYL